MTKNMVVTKDDLAYDGKNIIIPGYWVSTIAEFLHKATLPPNHTIDECDMIDIQTFKEFLFAIEEHKNQGH